MEYKARYRKIVSGGMAVLCESYIRHCRNCNYKYKKYAVRCDPREDDELICPECNEPRQMCNTIAVRKRPDGVLRFELDDEGYIIKGKPKCRFHGGIAGNSKIIERMDREKVDVIFNQIYEDGQREFYEDILELDKSDLADKMASYMVSKIFTIEDREDLTDKEKVRLQGQLHKISQGWLKSLKDMKTISDDVEWREALMERQAEIQKRAYGDAVIFILGIVKELLGMSSVEIVRDGLPPKLKKLAGDVIEVDIVE